MQVRQWLTNKRKRDREWQSQKNLWQRIIGFNLTSKAAIITSPELRDVPTAVKMKMVRVWEDALAARQPVLVL